MAIAFLERFDIDDAFYGKTISVFVRDGAAAIPAQHKKRVAVIYELSKLFEPGRSYPESEVNRIIRAYNDDYCLIRREMVSLGLMMRQNGIYTRSLD
ncbi:MAG: DUF2087 domain-containing protein [Clostridia bacterium]|nr:DUF2087 domain-containing protein [Clostridia bacterium]